MEASLTKVPVREKNMWTTCYELRIIASFTSLPGAINGTGSIHFYIAFFRSVLHASLDVPEYFGWTTYSVFREFVFIPGRPLEDLELHHRDANGLPAPPNTRKTRANLKVLTFLGGIDRAREKRWAERILNPLES